MTKLTPEQTALLKEYNKEAIPVLKELLKVFKPQEMGFSYSEGSENLYSYLSGLSDVSVENVDQYYKQKPKTEKCRLQSPAPNVTIERTRYANHEVDWEGSSEDVALSKLFTTARDRVITPKLEEIAARAAKGKLKLDQLPDEDREFVLAAAKLEDFAKNWLDNGKYDKVYEIVRAYADTIVEKEEKRIQDETNHDQTTQASYLSDLLGAARSRINKGKGDDLPAH